MPSRRAFLGGSAALICAPAIVRAASIMSVRSIEIAPAGFVAGERILKGQIIAFLPDRKTVYRVGVGSADSDINTVKRAACFAGNPDFGVASETVLRGQPIQIWELPEQIMRGMQS